MKRAAPDTAADDTASAPPPAKRPATGPAATMVAIESDDPVVMARCWVPEWATG
jgi:hypothetical protein